MIGVHVRIENNINEEIQQIAKARGVPHSQIFREIIALGLKSMNKESLKLDNTHTEKGASAAIESLLLLRKMASNINPDWIIQAHEEASKNINKG